MAPPDEQGRGGDCDDHGRCKVLDVGSCVVAMFLCAAQNIGWHGTKSLTLKCGLGWSSRDGTKPATRPAQDLLDLVGCRRRDHPCPRSRDPRVVDVPGCRGPAR